MTVFKAYVATGAGGVANTWTLVDDPSKKVPFVDTPVPPNPPPPGYVTPTVANMTNVLDDQFTTLDPTRWKVYDNSNFGAPTRVQLYKAANVTVGTGTAGATNGTSMKVASQRQAVTFNGANYNFTAGMLDTQGVGKFYPRYGRYEFRCKTPHGQGLWPSIWLTAKNGGATTVELDILEYFHAQIPAKNSTTLHGTDATGTFHANRYTNNGNAANGGYGRTFFEAPTYTPGWHVWTQDIIPVTDATGTTRGDINAPSAYVQFTTYLDGKVVFQFVDTSATYWTTNAGTADQCWQFYVQGCQIDGTYVGGPDDPLGYSHQLGACLIGGTAPNACTVTTGGYTVQRAQFTDPASVLEVDYVRVYKLTS